MSENDNLHLVVSSHLDMVKGVGRRPEWSVTPGGKVTGSLDNLAGSAIVLASFPKLMQCASEVQFTQDEEKGWPHMTGANRIAKRLKKMANPFVVVVDVANAQGDEDILLGNSYRFDSNQLVERLRSGLVKHKTAVETLDFNNPENEDETWTYAKNGIPCVALYLPVVGDFHTKKAWTTANRISFLQSALQETVYGLRMGYLKSQPTSA